MAPFPLDRVLFRYPCRMLYETTRNGPVPRITLDQATRSNATNRPPSADSILNNISGISWLAELCLLDHREMEVSLIRIHASFRTFGPGL